MDVVIAQDFFPKIGGAHLWLYEIYRRWPVPITILTRSFPVGSEQYRAAEAYDRLDHGAARIIRGDIGVDDINLVDSRCRRRFASAAGLVRSLMTERPATIHCLRAFPEGLLGLWSRSLRVRSVRLVVYAHGEEVLVARSSRQLRLITQLVYRLADLVIANSRSTATLVRELCPKAEVVCIHPGVEVAAYERPKEDLARFRAQWRWPAETTVVGTIARMEPRKNQSAVIRAVAALRQSGLPIAYVCAGDGEERQRLQALVSELGIQDWVRFTGAVPEAEKVMTYGACDFCAMPSIRVGEMIEGFSIVFLEAGAAGTPSICGNIGGQPEAVLDGRTGLVVDGTDLRQVQLAIERLATDVPLRTRMGREAAIWARSHDWSSVSAQALAAIEARVAVVPNARKPKPHSVA